MYLSYHPIWTREHQVVNARKTAACCTNIRTMTESPVAEQYVVAGSLEEKTYIYIFELNICICCVYIYIYVEASTSRRLEAFPERL